EYRGLRANQALLTRLSDVSGGVVHPPLPGFRTIRNPDAAEAPLFRHGGRTRAAPQDLWPLLLLLAALLFPLDVGIRRLMLSPEEILGYARRGIGGGGARLPARAPRPGRGRALSRRLSAKERPDTETR